MQMILPRQQLPSQKEINFLLANEVYLSKTLRFSHAGYPSWTVLNVLDDLYSALKQQKKLTLLEDVTPLVMEYRSSVAVHNFYHYLLEENLIRQSLVNPPIKNPQDHPVFITPKKNKGDLPN